MPVPKTHELTGVLQYNGRNLSVAEYPIGSSPVMLSLAKVAVSLAEQFRDAWDAVRHNANLSEIGKRDKVFEEAQSAVQGCSALMYEAKKMEAKADEMERALFAVPQIADGDVKGALQDMEIRQWLSGRSSGEMINLINPKDHPEAALAVLRAPYPVVPEAVRERIEIAWKNAAVERAPEDVKAITRMRDESSWGVRTVYPIAQVVLTQLRACGFDQQWITKMVSKFDFVVAPAFQVSGAEVVAFKARVQALGHAKAA